MMGALEAIYRAHRGGKSGFKTIGAIVEVSYASGHRHIGMLSKVAGMPGTFYLDELVRSRKLDETTPIDVYTGVCLYVTDNAVTWVRLFKPSDVDATLLEQLKPADADDDS